MPPHYRVRTPGGPIEAAPMSAHRKLSWSFRDAANFLGDRKSRTVPNLKATRIVRDVDAISLMYHATPVVTWYPNGIIEARSGGFRTATTKQRINSFLGPDVRVQQKNYEWKVGVGRDVTVPFRDGMVFHPEQNQVAIPTTLATGPTAPKRVYEARMPNLRPGDISKATYARDGYNPGVRL